MSCWFYVISTEYLDKTNRTKITIRNNWKLLKNCYTIGKLLRFIVNRV